MKRIITTPRPDYKKKLEEQSFKFHSLQDIYWDESAYYEFSLAEINKIETATEELYEMCLAAVQHIIDKGRYDELFINPNIIPLIERSWENEEPSFYGRFDLGFDGANVKMLEFNADTPTSLYEAAVVQWYWLQELFPLKDQFNSIHEKLLGYFQGARPYFAGEKVHFACVTDSIEDFTTVEYIRDLAHQAGLITEQIYMNQIGWNEQRRTFTDTNERNIRYIFKLYPWEWLSNEEFGDNLSRDREECQWIEAPWKAVLSNKGILPILWELYPNHPLLLESYFERPHGMREYVEKPIYSREGANVSIKKASSILNHTVVVEETGGEYGEEGYIYQQRFGVPEFDGNYPVIGSWVIDQQPAGMGIREDKSLITGNLSRFVPHLIS